MKTIKKTGILFLMVFLSASLNAQVGGQVRITPDEMGIERIRDFVSLSFPESQQTEKVGFPQLPYITRSYVIPVDAEVTGVRVNTLSRQRLDGLFRIYPAQPPIPTGIADNDQPFAINDSVYTTPNPYPAEKAGIIYDGFDRGYHIVTVGIYPVEYLPSKKEVYLLNLDYTIEYSVSDVKKNRQTFKQTTKGANYARNHIKSIVQNPNSVEAFSPSVVISRQVQNASFGGSRTNLRSMPVTDELFPEYIIITNEQLKPAFQALADWKTKKGILTTIKTVEEIVGAYPGSDKPEKIRNYIIECSQKAGQGNLYVLLGGDYNIIPAKKYLSVDYIDEGIYKAVDLYYVTINGIWNTNYPSQNMTVTIGSILGRAPVETMEEVNTFVNKVIAYEKASVSDKNYYNNLLISNSFLVNSGSSLYNQGKYALAQRINYPAHINKWFLFDDYTCTGSSSRYKYQTATDSWTDGPCITGDEELTAANVLSALRDGGNSPYNYFHIIYHMDHGSPHANGISSKDKGQRLTREDMGSLTNNAYQQIFITGSCESADFEKECFAESYLLNRNGGAVAYIGNSDNGYVSERYQFNNFINAWKNQTTPNSLGYLFQQVQSLNPSGSKTGYNRKMALLGDPEMQVWTGTPKNMTVTVTPSSLVTGNNTVSVTVSGLPAGQKATVCLWKKEEVYASEEVTGNGTYIFTVAPQTTGTMDITITARDFIPKEITRMVGTNSGRSLHIDTLIVDDVRAGQIIGNGDRRMDAGETAGLTFNVKNSGLAVANNVSATLSCNSSHITIINNQASFGNISSGSVISSQSKYIIKIDKDINRILKNDPDAINFTLHLKDAVNNTYIDSCKVDIFAPELEQRNKIITWTSDGNKTINAGETVRLNMELFNNGKADATGLTATLSAVTSGITMVSGQRSYPVIKQFETKQSTAVFEFKAPGNYNGSGGLNFKLNVRNEYGRNWDFSFNLANRPSIPNVSTFKANAGASEIELTWNAVSQAVGYNIYRSDAGTNGQDLGNYTKLNIHPVSNPLYKDYDLAQLTKYYYKISAVSIDAIEGELSNSLIASTTYPLKDGYPLQMYSSYNIAGSDGAVKTMEIDNSGYKKIFTTFRNSSNFPKEGYIEVLNHDGTELYKIGNNETNNTGFAQFDTWVQELAVGDLFGTGEYQVVSATRDAGDSRKNYITCHSLKDENADNNPDVIWKKSTGDACYWTNPIIANLDNSADGSKEIVILTDGNTPGNLKNIQIFDCNGNLRQTLESGINSYDALAVADMDGDGDMEIIVGKTEWWSTNTSGSINIWHHNGTPYWGATPFYTRTNYHFKTPVIANLDNSIDGSKEIIIAGLFNNTGNAVIHVIKSDATLDSNWGRQNIPVDPSNYSIRSLTLSVGDIDGDTYLEVVAIGENWLKAWKHNGAELLSVSIPNLRPKISAPILANVDDDNELEIVFGDNHSNLIRAYKKNGKLALGFPLYLDENVSVANTLCVDDIDDNGYNDIIVSAGDKIYVWETAGLSDVTGWGSFRYDQQNTGEYRPNCENKIINSNETWSGNLNFCGNIIIESGTLTLNSNCILTMNKSNIIIIKSGASLVVNGGKIMNANIKALPQSTLALQNNGYLKLRPKGEVNINNKAIFNYSYGEIAYP